MPRVVVQLTHEASHALRAGGARSAELDAVVRAVSERNAAIQPLDPAPVHPLLAPFFVVDLSTAADAQELIARLQGNSVVIAAYTEPQVDLP